MKVSVDSDRCGGHGVCTSLCPEMFSLNDNGYAEVQQHVVPPALEESVKLAAQSCPEWAIETD